MKSSRVLRSWREYGVKAVAVLLTALLATQMVGTPAFASLEQSEKAAEEQIATEVKDVAADEPAETTATETETSNATEGDGSSNASNEAESDASGTASAASSESNSASTGPTASDQQVDVQLDLAAETTLSYDGVTYGSGDESMKAPANEELKFTVSASEGYQVESVETTIDGVAAALEANESGEYTLPAANVTDGTTIRVTTEAVPTEETTETDDTTVEDEESTPVTLSVEVANSTVTLTNVEGEEQKVSESQDVEVAAGEDLALTVEPAEDYELESVTVTDADETSEVSGDDGVYTIPADQVVEGSSIQISAVAAAKAQAARATSQSLNVGDRVAVRCTNDDRWHSHSWTSSNRQVATVTTDKKGYIYQTQREDQTVTAVAPGDAEIKCGNTVILTVHVEVSEITVNFDPNGGQGERFTKTTSEIENGNYRMSLPTLEESGFSRDGYTFVGWSTDRTGEGQTYTPQEITVSDGQTYYAIWAKNDAEGEVRAEFFLRIRGDIPYEPDANIGGGGAGYFPGGCSTGMWGSIKQGVAINNNNALVAANINEAPSDATIQAEIEEWNGTHTSENRMSYDPDTQEIVWYVIKKSGDHYHVDGVIVDKAEHWVSYNPNGGTSHVPTGKQYMEGATVDVDFTAIPSKAGYTFLGWDTDRNVTTPTYTEGGTNSFDMPASNVTLYAIWQEKDAVIYTYSVDPGEGGKLSNYSDTVKPDTGEPKGSTPTANEYYEFAGWYNSNDEKITTENAAANGVELEGDTLTPIKNDEGVFTGGSFTAKFNQVKFKGSDITIVVYKNGEQINAEGTVEPSNWEDRTEGIFFTLQEDGLSYKVEYIYEELDCADFLLGVSVPDGYTATITTPEAGAETEGVEFSATDVSDGADGTSWQLDNVPGGSTVRVDLTANTDTEYKVNVYFQSEGAYPEDPDETYTLDDGTTDAKVSIDQDAYVKDGYAFDGTQDNVLEATCAGDGSTVLEVYYKQQFTVTYQPGDHAADGSQAQSTGSLDWGAKTPEAPEYEGAPGYSFAGWSTEVAETVTADVTYVAQWTPNFDDFGIVADAEGGHWTYNGSERKIELEGVYPGDELEYVITYADKTTKKVIATVAADGTITDEPVFKNFSDTSAIVVTVTRGGQTDQASTAMTIDKVQIAVTDQKSALFDGSQKTLTIGEGDAGQYEVDGKTADRETLKVTAKVTGTEVGRHTAVVGTAEDGSIWTIENGLTENYDVKVNGTLRIFAQSIDDDDPEFPDPTDPDPADPDPNDPDTPDDTDYYGGVTVKLDGPDNTPYNGAEQKLPFKVLDKDGNDLSTQYYDYEYSGDTTNVGEVTITITGKNGYSGTAELKYRITKVDLLITTASDVKIYDGTALTNPGITFGDADGSKGFKGDDANKVSIYTTGTQTEVGTSWNSYGVDDQSNILRNYNVTASLGTLKVVASSIDPDDPDPLPDPDDPVVPDPDDPDNPDPVDPNPDPDNPDPDVYGGVTVDEPQDSVYDGTDNKWAPVVTSDDDQVLVEGTDYTVAYFRNGQATDNFSDAGTIEVVVTGIGGYSGTYEDSYVISPRPITVVTDSASKVYDGTALTAGGRVENLVAGETVTVNTSSRTEVGTSDNLYTLTWGTADPANYTIVGETIGTLTVTAVPVTPIPTPDPDGGDDDGIDDGTTPATDPGTADDATAEEAIAEGEIPLAASAGGVEIVDDATPMAGGDHPDCWVHWFMILGIVVTVAYTAGVVGRRSKFSGDLKDYEDKVLGNNQNNQ